VPIRLLVLFLARWHLCPCELRTGEEQQLRSQLGERLLDVCDTHAVRLQLVQAPSAALVQLQRQLRPRVRLR